jgi:hypothetical protein
MRTAELVANAAWIALGLGICFYALRLKLWAPATGPGSGFLPFIAGVFVTLIGVALLAREWSRRPRAPEAAPFWPDPAGRTRVGLVVAALCAMAYLMPFLGFFAAAVLVMVFLLSLAERARLGSSIALAIVSTAAIYWLFGRLLQVRLPRGPLGF